jgi:hypothetical protein
MDDKYYESAQITSSSYGIYSKELYVVKDGSRDVPNAVGLQNIKHRLLSSSGVDWRLNPKLVNILCKVSTAFGRNITIISGFSALETNKKITGTDRDQHMLGEAVDIDVSKFTPKEIQQLLIISSKYGIIGIGIYTSDGVVDRIHVDIRETRRVVWGDGYVSNNIPIAYAEFVHNHTEGKISNA